MLSHVSSEKYLKRLAGRTDLEDALKRLDKLTQEEARMAAAQLLKITNNIENKITQVIDGERYTLSWLSRYSKSICGQMGRKRRRQRRMLRPCCNKL